MQITLTDETKGLLQGTYSAHVSIIDNATQKTYWEEDQHLLFDRGFAEIILGPVESLLDIETPYVRVFIDGSTIQFPIYPSLLAVHSNTATQLSDTDALYVRQGRVGLGTSIPSEKLTVKGNLKFLDNTNKIIFGNGSYISKEGYATVSSNSALVPSIKTQLDTLESEVALLGNSNGNESNILLLNTSLATVSANVADHGNALNTLSSNISTLTSDVSNINDSIDSYNNIAASLQQHTTSINVLINHNATMVSSMSTAQSDISTISSNVSVLNTALSTNTTAITTVSANVLDLTTRVSGLESTFGNYNELNTTLSGHTNAIDTVSGNVSLISVKLNQHATTIDSHTTTINANQSSIASLSSTLEQHATTIDRHTTTINANQSSIASLSSTLDQHTTTIDRHTTTINALSNSNDTILSTLDHHATTINQLTTDMTLKLNKTAFDDWKGLATHTFTTVSLNTLALTPRTESLPSNPKQGSIVFEDTEFKGYDGTKWVTLSLEPTLNTSSTPGTYWASTESTLSTQHNLGIGVANPQAKLDVQGQVRFKLLSQQQELTHVLVKNTDGFLYYKTISAADFITNANDSQVILDGNTLKLATMNASAGDILTWNGSNWTPSENTPLSPPSPYTGSHGIVINDNTISITANGAESGDILTWNGSNWIPSENTASSTPINYTGGTGITVNGDTISLSDTVNFSGSLFKLNNLSSTVEKPLSIVHGTTETLTISQEGRLTIALPGEEDQAWYSIASGGLNYFSNMITNFQAAIGTNNIGTVVDGPTLLVQSTYSENPSTIRSAMEVLNPDGESLLEIQDRGYVGIGTNEPNATLDINGVARLKKYSSQPDVGCSLASDGAIALTSRYTLCVCKGEILDWVETSDGSTPCDWD
jgi:hypothetical protein